MNDNIIEITNLQFLDIFNDFNIKLQKNKFITISGPNNCGKTSLIRILDRQIKSEGTILLNNKNLKDYKVTELAELVKTVIPMEIEFMLETVEEELKYALDNTRLSFEEKKESYKEMIKKLKLTKYQTKNPIDLEEAIQIKVQLALALVTKPPVLLLDNIMKGFVSKEREEVLTFLEEVQKKDHLSIIMTTNNLKDSYVSDYLYIISDSKVVLEGKTLDVLENDTTLNKIGLRLPFMMDLSVKLKDYDLIKERELEIDRMVNTLWK